MSTPTHHPETVIIAADALPTVEASREFDAPLANVFRAHTDPELYARWSGPHELSTSIGVWDCRTGGAWSYKNTDDSGNEYDFYGSFHEIRANEVIVQTLTFAGFPDSVSLERLSFDDLGNNRCRLITVSLFDSFEGRDAMIASGMEAGISEGYDKLDDLLVNGDPSDKGTV